MEKLASWLKQNGAVHYVNMPSKDAAHTAIWIYPRVVEGLPKGDARKRASAQRIFARLLHQQLTDHGQEDQLKDLTARLESLKDDQTPFQPAYVVLESKDGKGNEKLAKLEAELKKLNVPKMNQTESAMSVLADLI